MVLEIDSDLLGLEQNFGHSLKLLGCVDEFEWRLFERLRGDRLAGGEEGGGVGEMTSLIVVWVETGPVTPLAPGLILCRVAEFHEGYIFI